MKQLFINGRFLTRPITGVQRFAREIVWALDSLLEEKEETRRFILVAPKGTPRPSGLKKIEFMTCGHMQGHFWEQWDLWRATQKGILLSLTNSGPVLHPNHMVILHDVLVYKFPHIYSFAYRMLHQTLGTLLAQQAKIGTVSKFSRDELSQLLGIEKSNIPIIYNGHEHILHHVPDNNVLEKLDIKDKTFLLFVGSPVQSKNLKRAIEAFALTQRKDVLFIVVGAAQAKVFSGEIKFVPEGVIRTGRLTDNELVSLYKHATALIFPSLYEGFGIPPLEAMVHGCPVIASNIPPVKEVCGDAALYFDPMDIEDISSKIKTVLSDQNLRHNLAEKGNNRFASFSWKKSAENLFPALTTKGI